MYIYVCTIYIYIYICEICDIYTINSSTKFQLNQTWRLTKAIAEMKCDTELTMNLEWLYKVGSES